MTIKTRTKIKCEFTDSELRNIATAVLIYLSQLEKNTDMNFDEHPLIQRYLKIYDYINDLQK